MTVYLYPSVLLKVATPPANPALGDRYLVETGGSGDWAGHDHQIAEWAL